MEACGRLQNHANQRLADVRARKARRFPGNPATAYMQPYNGTGVFTQVIDYHVFMRHIPFFYVKRMFW